MGLQFLNKDLVHQYRGGKGTFSVVLIGNNSLGSQNPKNWGKLPPKWDQYYWIFLAIELINKLSQKDNIATNREQIHP